MSQAMPASLGHFPPLYDLSNFSHENQHFIDCTHITPFPRVFLGAWRVLAVLALPGSEQMGAPPHGSPND